MVLQLAGVRAKFPVGPKSLVAFREFDQPRADSALAVCGLAHDRASELPPHRAKESPGGNADDVPLCSLRSPVQVRAAILLEMLVYRLKEGRFSSLPFVGNSLRGRSGDLVSRVHTVGVIASQQHPCGAVPRNRPHVRGGKWMLIPLVRAHKMTG